MKLLYKPEQIRIPFCFRNFPCGPERSVDIEFSSPGRARKKERYRFGIVLFSSARRGSKPFPPLQGFSNGLPVETLQRGEVDPSASLAIMFLSCQKLGSRRRRQYYPQLLRHETLYHNPLILSMFLHVSLVL